MNFDSMWIEIQHVAITYGLRIVGAIFTFIIGRWVIRLIIKGISRAIAAKEFDATLQKYMRSIISVGLNILLIVSILAQFGIETTSFAALLAALGLAIGTAWGGLLANFAAGAFLLVLRPFKVGDVISAAGANGVVDEIGLFVTTITASDGTKIYLGNNNIFSDNIQNFTDIQFRRIERTMQLAHAANVDDTIERLRTAIQAVPGVLDKPEPEIWVMDFTLAGAVLAVRPYCKPADYVRVLSETNNVIRRVTDEANLPVPEMSYVMRTTVHPGKS